MREGGQEACGAAHAAQGVRCQEMGHVDLRTAETLSALIPTFLDEDLFDDDLEVAVDEQLKGDASRWEQEERERQRAFDQGAQ